MLLTCGLPDITNAAGTRPTQAFTESQGFMDDEDLKIMSVKNVTNMINTHNSINGQTVILGSVNQHNVQALIYWAKDKKLRWMVIIAANWNTTQMTEAIERVNSDVPEKEVERLGSLEIGVKWTVWETKWENYLG